MIRGDDPVAKVTIRDACRMTPTGRKWVADWLRSQAAALEKEGADYAKKFTARHVPVKYVPEHILPKEQEENDPLRRASLRAGRCQCDNSTQMQKHVFGKGWFCDFCGLPL